MDYGKFKYESAQKAREARRNQALTVIKEMRLRLKIDPHDYETKKGHVERFLRGGDKVKITVMFRGREQSRPEMGYRLLQRLAQDVSELGVVEGREGRRGAGPAGLTGRRTAPPDARRRNRWTPRQLLGCRDVDVPRRRHTRTRTEDMPKQKTHKGTAKRVRVTGTGKLMREQANNQHKFEHKSSRRKRRLDQDQVISPADTKSLKKLLGL
jgi:translation initiation factor IF-3